MGHATHWAGRLLLVGCLLIGPTFGSAAALAQSFPSRTVTIIVTSNPGALTDVLARAFGQRLSQIWNQNVVIENKAGGAYAIAATAATLAAPDGHTLLVTENGMFTIQPNLTRNRGYKATDFVPVANFARIAMALFAHPSVLVKSTAELIALAKQKPEIISYGTAGVGTAPHMATLLLERMAAVKLTPVHYRGMPLAMNDLIGGHINTLTTGPSALLPAWRDGKVNMLSIGSPQRLPQLANIPTTAETVPGYEASVSFGLYTLAATPPATIAKINADVQQIMREPAFQERILHPQLLEAMAGPPEAFAREIEVDTRKWGKVIEDAKLKVE
jgi:tripartite-type tricarboxylate transporter receptor subunit TctC